MTDCCDDLACEIEKLQRSQLRILKIVLLINLGMFAVEAVAAFIAGSLSLFSDSLDMLGDALVYGLSIYVVARNPRWKAASSLTKGAIMLAFGLGALAQAIHALLVPHVPTYQTIGLVGAAALLANATCLILLQKHKSDDINMHSVWVCSRNDILANSSVLVAALAVWLSHAGWPDIVIGVGIAAVIIHSALSVIKRSLAGLKKGNA
jgi:Co/Zn/Cd efflux system component